MNKNLLIPNWNDGMKIGAKHFIDFQNALLTHSFNAAALSTGGNNYGLLKPEDGKSLVLEITDKTTGLIGVKLWSCKAVTMSGYYVEFNATNEADGLKPLTAEYVLTEGKPKFIYAVLIVDPFNRVPVGEPDAQSIPLRYPYSLAAYKLTLLPEEQVNTMNVGGNLIPVGRLVLSGSQYEEDKKYVPPCTAIINHPLLLETFLETKKYTGEILDACIKITQKVVEKGQKLSLAVNLMRMCEMLAFKIASERFNLNSILVNASPIHALATFSGLAGICRVFIHCLTDRDREDILNYLGEWSTKGGGKIESLISTTFHIDYNHNLIYDSWLPVRNFVEVFAVTLTQIAKLEMIGQTKEDENWLVMGGEGKMKNPAQQQFVKQQEAPIVNPAMRPKPVVQPEQPARPAATPTPYQQKPEPPQKKGWGLE